MQMYTMMRCEVCATRTFILWALRSEQQLYAATYALTLVMILPTMFLTDLMFLCVCVSCVSCVCRVCVCASNSNFVLLLLEVPLPIMVMTTHELTINDYLFMRVPVRAFFFFY
jgi:hypothetical protein